LESYGAGEMSKLQKAVAPNLIRGSDLIVISADGGMQSGKQARALSYFLPMIRLMYGKYETTEEVRNSSKVI